MTAETDIQENAGKRGFFSAELRNLAARYRIRGLAMAKALDVTPQYVSKLLTAKNLPTPSQLKKILNFLETFGTGAEERHLLVNSFIRDKTGFLFDCMDWEYNAHNALERRLLADFRQLKAEQQKDVLKLIADFSIQNMQGEEL